MEQHHSLWSYYKYVFPDRLVWRYLNACKHREFAFVTKDDVQIRFQSYESSSEFSKTLKERVPFKIDVGGEYTLLTSGSGDDSKQMIDSEKCYGRELIFDIDANDYPAECRPGCKCVESLCARCWPLMEAAVLVLDSALRLDFGYEDIHFFFSGRRGVHCWVRDARAILLTQEARHAIMNYMTLIIPDKTERKMSKYWDIHGSLQIQYSSSDQSYSLHPKLERDFELLEPCFVRLIEHQGDAMFKGVRGFEALTDLTSRSYAQSNAVLKGGMNDSKMLQLLQHEKCGPEQTWKIFKLCVRKTLNLNKQYWDIRKAVYAIVFFYMYPRFDTKVTTGLTHLIKCPFSAHPKTGRICVPLPIVCSSFDPQTVPTIQELEQQVANLSTTDRSAWKHTTLAPYIYAFKASAATETTAVDAGSTEW
jgi:DNA primase small subunit